MPVVRRALIAAVVGLSVLAALLVVDGAARTRRDSATANQAATSFLTAETGGLRSRSEPTEGHGTGGGASGRLRVFVLAIVAAAVGLTARRRTAAPAAPKFLRRGTAGVASMRAPPTATA